MGFNVRQIEPNDIDQLYELFSKRKSKELLSWVYGHPAVEGRSGYVAEEGGKIVGAVGFVKNQYLINGQVKSGIIPLSWEVSEGSRGLVGMRLIFKVLSGADFYMGMDGSDDMRNIFKGLNFRQIEEGIGARKVLHPFDYLKTLNKIGIKDLFRFATDVFIWMFKRNTSSLVLEEINDYDPEKYEKPEKGFYNPISRDHLLWLSNNPGMKMQAFEVDIKGRKYGPVICFMKEIKNGKSRGQLIHIPLFNDNDKKYYPDLILAVESFLYNKGVTSISTLAVDGYLKTVLKKMNYRFDIKTRPIVAKGSKDVLEMLAQSEIHLSYAESDKSVRNI